MDYWRSYCNRYLVKCHENRWSTRCDSPLSTPAAPLLALTRFHAACRFCRVSAACSRPPVPAVGFADPVAGCSCNVPAVSPLAVSGPASPCRLPARPGCPGIWRMSLWLCMSSVTHSRSVLRHRLLASAAPATATTTCADFSLRMNRRPFRRKARSPQVRTHTFIAQPPHLRHFALVTRASWLHAHSPCLAAPSMQFLFIGSRFTLHASFPRSVAITQLRFTLLAVTSSQRDLHPQVCAHAGRTSENAQPRTVGRQLVVARGGIEPSTRGFSVRCSTN